MGIVWLKKAGGLFPDVPKPFVIAWKQGRQKAFLGTAASFKEINDSTSKSLKRKDGHQAMKPKQVYSLNLNFARLCSLVEPRLYI